MVWTAPRTWVAGELVTAALLNTHLRDELLMLSDAWDSYVPTWAGSTNPAIGNGTIEGNVMQLGKWVRFSIKITMGSTTTYGSGSWTLTLPVAPVVSNVAGFNAILRDTSIPDSHPGISEHLTGTTMNLRCWPATAGNAFRNVTPTVPFTWASTDILTVWGEYEAA